MNPFLATLGAPCPLMGAGLPDWARLAAEVESFRGPKESDLSMAGRAGIGVKTLRDWLKRRHWPRETTLDGARQRWRETRHLVDPNIPSPRNDGKPQERQIAVPLNTAQRGLAKSTTAESDHSPRSGAPLSLGATEAQMTDDVMHSALVIARRKLAGNPDLELQWAERAMALAQELARLPKSDSTSEGQT